MREVTSTALVSIDVAVVVERRKAKSPWLDFVWRPVAVLAGLPEAEPWTALNAIEETRLFYAGSAVIELFRTETANYRSNLASETPSLWVALRREPSGHAYKLLAVTADPAEGEALSASGNDLVEAVPMPPMIAKTISDFVSQHHVERSFVKRRREPARSHVAARGSGQKRAADGCA
jgi:Protein of unknown function (DUF3305)